MENNVSPYIINRLRVVLVFMPKNVRRMEMKFMKLFSSAAAIFLLVVLSSGAAMAEGCGDGVLEGETFDGNLIVSDERSCTIISSTIKGNLTVRDTDNVALLNNKVGGQIQVIRTDGQEGIGVANVIANTLFAGGLLVEEYATANVIENETLTISISVRGNTNALVQKNIAAKKINCIGNTTLSAFLNYAGETLNCK